jgi:hypothetical protein
MTDSRKRVVRAYTHTHTHTHTHPPSLERNNWIVNYGAIAHLQVPLVILGQDMVIFVVRTHLHLRLHFGPIGFCVSLPYSTGVTVEEELLRLHPMPPIIRTSLQSIPTYGDFGLPQIHVQFGSGPIPLFAHVTLLRHVATFTLLVRLAEKGQIYNRLAHNF